MVSIWAVRVARIEWRAIERHLRDDPEFSLALADSIAGHLGRLIDRTADQSLLTVPERLVRYLLSKNPDANGKPTVRLPFSKSLLARDLGVTPETLSRAFAQLAELGVTIDNRDIHVRDIEALRASVALDGALEESA